jgi:hypothetical protein
MGEEVAGVLLDLVRHLEQFFRGELAAAPRGTPAGAPAGGEGAAGAANGLLPRRCLTAGTSPPP